jgi:hypothetical protein
MDAVARFILPLAITAACWQAGITKRLDFPAAAADWHGG